MFHDKINPQKLPQLLITIGLLPFLLLLIISILGVFGFAVMLLSVAMMIFAYVGIKKSGIKMGKPKTKGWIGLFLGGCTIYLSLILTIIVWPPLFFIFMSGSIAVLIGSLFILINFYRIEPILGMFAGALLFPLLLTWGPDLIFEKLLILIPVFGFIGGIVGLKSKKLGGWTMIITGLLGLLLTLVFLLGKLYWSTAEFIPVIFFGMVLLLLSGWFLVFDLPKVESAVGISLIIFLTTHVFFIYPQLVSIPSHIFFPPWLWAEVVVLSVGIVGGLVSLKKEKIGAVIMLISGIVCAFFLERLLSPVFVAGLFLILMGSLILYKEYVER